MNRFHQILPYIVLVGLPMTGAAQLVAGPDAAGARVSNFEAVSKQLEPGGTVYAYLDLEGDAEVLGEFGNVLLAWGREQSGGALPPGLSAPGLISALGLDRVKAVGFSSRPMGNGMFHNRAVLHMPEGRSGIFNLMGGPAAPFRSPRMAPADSDWVMESDLTLGAALELAESVVRSLGDPQWLQQYHTALGFPMPMPGLEMTVKDFVGRLNSRVIIAGNLLEGKNFQLPGSGMKLPCFQTLVSFEGIDFLFPPLLELMESTGKTVVERDAGFVKIRQAESNTGDLEFLQPVICPDPAGARILLASHPEILEKWLAPGEKLEGSPRFQAAMAGLPAEGNELTYVTPLVIDTLTAAFGGGLRQSLEVPWAAGAGADSLISLLWEEWRRQNPSPQQPVAAVRANQPTGMTVHSNVAGSNKFVLAAAGLSLPVAAGLTGVVGIGKKQTSAVPIIPGAGHEAGNPGYNKEKDAEDDVSGAVRANLKQISFAAATLFLSDPGATEVTYEKLIEENLLFAIPAVAAESYKGLKLERAGGTLSLQVEDGLKVDYEYPPVLK